MAQTHFGVCNFCDASCGPEIRTEGRKILSIRGDAQDPFSKGHICPKGTAHQDLFEDPDRLRSPVRRAGDRHEPIKWAEAIGLVARKITELQKRHGKDSVAIYYGNPVGHSYQTMFSLIAFWKSLNSRSVYSANSVDAHPRMLVSRLLFGNQALLPVPDIERTDFFVVMGANPVVSNGSIMGAPDVKKRLKAIRARGGRIIVIDPRRTETAAIADAHHFIRPGSDALLLLAVLQVLFAEGLVAPSAGRRARGVDELARLVARYPPERVEDCVGITAGSIRELARAFARARTAVWYGRMGTSTQEFGCLSTWLIDAVNVVTGNFDRAGGAMFNTPAVDLAGLARLIREPGHFDRWRTRVGGLPELNGEFPVAALADEIETPGEGQIRALITVAGNPVLATPNGRRLDRALSGLEFMVSLDPYLNETTRHAHLILPPTTALEGSHYPLLEHAMGVRNVTHFAPAVFPPEPEARADWEILLELVRGIGRERGGLERVKSRAVGLLGRALQSDALLDLLLAVGPHHLRLRQLRAAPHGLDLGPLAPRLDEVIQTADRRIDLAPPRLLDDVQRLEARWLSADAAPGPRRELVLVTRRTLRSMNSWLHNTPRLMRGPSRCVLQMHPDDALACGIGAAERVRVTSRTGEIEVPVALTTEMMPGVVSLPHGFGHDRPGSRLSVAREHAGASLNDLADETLFDAITGTSVLDGIPVRVAAL